MVAVATLALGMVACSDKEDAPASTQTQYSSLANSVFISYLNTVGGGAKTHLLSFSKSDTCSYAVFTYNDDDEITNSTFYGGIFTYAAKGSGTIHFYDTSFTTSYGTASFSIDANSKLTLNFNGETIEMGKSNIGDNDAYAWLDDTQWQFSSEDTNGSIDIYLTFSESNANLDLHLPSTFIYGGGPYTMNGNRGTLQFEGLEQSPTADTTYPVNSTLYFEVMSEREIDLSYKTYTYTLTRIANEQ